MSKKSIFFERVARNFSSLFIVFALSATTVFAFTFWDSGEAPGAAPGVGNVEISSGKWEGNGSNIYFDSGNVGIGTTSPAYKLDITGSAWNNIARIYSTGSSSGLDFFDTNGTRRGVIYSSSAGFGLLNNTANWALRVNHGTNTIYAPGSVGIGTASPSRKLDVAGDIRSTGGYLINNSSPTIYFQDTNHRSAMLHTNNNYFYVLRGSGTNSTSWATVGGRWPLQIDLNSNDAYFGRNVYASAFYDYDNTGYYVNPAGTSLFGGDLRFNNYGVGVVGLYSATKYQNVFSMGSSYTPADNGSSLGSMYGIAWTHSNIGGESIAGLGHQALFVTNGDTRTAIGNGIWTKYNITGNQFIDRNNTGYYVDPAGTSRTGRINADNLYSYGWLYGTIFYDRNNTGYYVDPASTSKLNTVYSNVYYYSDKRLKKDIAVIPDSLDKILKLEGVSFEWKDTERGEGANIGLIAQEVEKVFPEAVVEDETTGMKLLQYSNLVAPLIEAVKEQQSQIDELKVEIAELKNGI